MLIFVNGKRRLKSFVEFYAINIKIKGLKFDHFKLSSAESTIPITQSM